MSSGGQESHSSPKCGIKVVEISNSNGRLASSVSFKESYDQPRQHIKKQRHYFVNKGPSSQGYGFSSSHGWM